MRLIDADKICVIPATDDNITGMGMTREEQDTYNEGVEAVMAKIRNAKTVDPYKDVLEIIDRARKPYILYAQAGLTESESQAITALYKVQRRVEALRYGGDVASLRGGGKE